MGRLKGTGKGYTYRTQIRFDEATDAYYRRRANEHGVSLSEYLRQILVQGVIAENVQEIELRLQAACAKMAEIFGNARMKTSTDENLKLAAYTSEELLKAIVEARDPQELYAAQDRAKRRVQRECS